VIDTHCHLLPGLDDGAKDDAAAIEMARIAEDDGVKTIIATPHMREGDYLNERSTVLDAVEALRPKLRDEGLQLDVVAGSEVHLGPRLAERVDAGRLLTYNDGRRYLLLECPYRNRPVRLDETVFELTVAGIVPVIAHPERIAFFQDDASRFEEIVRLGALGQMTSSSLLGTFGSRIQKLSEDWVERGLVHVLGSDAHDAKYRPPRLAEARDRWRELTDDECAELATVEWPACLVSGQVVDPEPPAPPSSSKGFLSRLFGR
jgi:protein-tyrosine phosphatase